MSMQEKRFEAWWCEREGIGLRAERFSTPDSAAWAAWQAAESAVIERCAKVCDEIANKFARRYDDYCDGMESGAYQCSDTIRALLNISAAHVTCSECATPPAAALCSPQLAARSPSHIEAWCGAVLTDDRIYKLLAPIADEEIMARNKASIIEAGRSLLAAATNDSTAKNG